VPWALVLSPIHSPKISGPLHIQEVDAFATQAFTSLLELLQCVWATSRKVKSRLMQLRSSFETPLRMHPQYVGNQPFSFDLIPDRFLKRCQNEERVRSRRLDLARTFQPMARLIEPALNSVDAGSADQIHRLVERPSNFMVDPGQVAFCLLPGDESPMPESADVQHGVSPGHAVCNP